MESNICVEVNKESLLWKSFMRAVADWMCINAWWWLASVSSKQGNAAEKFGPSVARLGNCSPCAIGSSRVVAPTWQWKVQACTRLPQCYQKGARLGVHQRDPAE